MEEGDLRNQYLISSINDASRHVRNILIPYLLLILYIILTLGSLTSRDFIFGSSLNLPLLNVETSLKGFFIFSPLFLIIIHTYFLIQIYLLSSQLHELKDNQDAVTDKGSAQNLHRILFPFFLNYVILKDQQPKSLRFLFQTLIRLTVIVLPLVTLIWIQFSYIQAYDSGITWLHRFLILADLFLIWMFWPRIMKGKWRLKKDTAALLVKVITVFGFFFFFCFLVTWPGELQYGILGMQKIQKLILSNAALDVEGEVLVTKEPPHELIIDAHRQFDQENDPRPGELDSLINIVYEKHSVPLDLQGKTFTMANFRDIRAVKADFSYANLESSDFSGAELYQSDFSFANLSQSDLSKANLAGAVLSFTDLSNTDLSDVDFTGILFSGVNMANSKLDGANLSLVTNHGLDLTNADLKGAIISIGSERIDAEEWLSNITAQNTFASPMGFEPENWDVKPKRFSGYPDDPIQKRLNYWKEDTVWVLTPKSSLSTSTPTER